MKFYKLGAGCVLVASVLSQTRVDLRTQSKSVDFSGASSTKPSQTGTVLPATCSVGQTFFNTAVPAGQNLYACTAVNVWTVEGGGGLSSVFGRTGAVTAQSGDYSAAQISGLAPSATTDATNATNITTGTLGAARLPAPGAATLGGVQSKDCSAGGQFLQKVNTDGTETCGTPAGGGNVTGPGTVTNGYLPLWGASNNLLTAGLAVSTVNAANTIPEAGAGGTLAAGWLPNAGSHTVNTTAPLSGGGAVALGGTLTLSCPTCLTANAVPSVFGRTGAVTSQSGDYSAAQISGLAPSATTDATNATNITTGTLGAARLPTPGAATLGGVASINCATGGQFVQAINTNGTETCGTPAGGGNVTGPGTVTNGYLPLWGASNNLLTAGLAVSTVNAANAVPEAGVGGTLAAGWLPNAGSHTVSTTAPLSGGGAVALGGTLTLSCPTCLTANAVPSVFGRTGAVTAQSGDYSAAQISGLAPSATTDTTNAGNIASGTLGAARLPTPGAATLGGVESINCSTGGQFVQAINTNGTETCATPAGSGGGISDPGASGMVVRTALNTTAAVTIGASSGITVTNGSGVSGNPLIGLDTTVAVTQAQVQTLAPLVCSATPTGNDYNCTMSPPPGAFVDTNNNPLAIEFCPTTTWAGGPVYANTGLAAKRILVYGYDPPANTFLANSCYLLAYNPAMTVDGVASVGAFELKSLPGVSPQLYIPNAATTGTTLNKLTKLTGAPSTAVSAATSDTGGMVGIAVAGAGTTLTAVIQTTGNTSCVFDGATTAGHYVQISSTAAGDCHDSGASFPTSGQVIGRVLATNGSAGTDAIQLFGAEVQAAATGTGSGTVTSVATTGPISGGTITTSGAIACPTCVTSAASLTNNAVVIGGGGQGSSSIAADTTTTHALFATTGAPAFRALTMGDIPAGVANTPIDVTFAFSATPTFSCGSGSAAVVTNFQFTSAMTANVTSSTVAICTPGQIINIYLLQDGTGARTFSPPANFDTPNINLAANAATKLSYWYDGVYGRLISSGVISTNGQTCTFGTTCNVNSGAAAHSVALNEGAGAAMTGAAIGTAGRLLIDQGAGNDPSFNAVSGDATITGAGAVTIAANAVTSAKMAVVNARRTCSVVVGADNGSALGNADIGPQGRQCFVPAAATVVEITIAADGGVPSVLVRKNHAGTATNMTSAAFATAASGGLACANGAGSGLGIDGATTCSTALTSTTLAAGDWLELASGTADGTAKRLSVNVTYTVN